MSQPALRGHCMEIQNNDTCTCICECMAGTKNYSLICAQCISNLFVSRCAAMKEPYLGI